MQQIPWKVQTPVGKWHGAKANINQTLQFPIQLVFGWSIITKQFQKQQIHCIKSQAWAFSQAL